MKPATNVSFKPVNHGGVFNHGDGYDKASDELDAAIDARESGGLTEADYISTLKTLILHYPDFIDGYAHLGFALTDQGNAELGLHACSRGFAIGERAIHAGFSGQIEWGPLENRPFLRAAHGMCLCHLQLGQRQHALDIMKKLLRWNPIDNQGVRFIIGSEYLRAGNWVTAERFFRDEAANYPPYHYEAGLLSLMRGQTIAAATNIRRGFATNPYVAELLCGNSTPMLLAIWHDSNLASAETARAYLGNSADLWRQVPNAIPFLHWLYNHPKVLLERSAVLGCKEALLWEQDALQRQKLFEAYETTNASIDDRLSNEIIFERRDRNGNIVVPWLLRQNGRKHA